MNTITGIGMISIENSHFFHFLTIEKPNEFTILCLDLDIVVVNEKSLADAVNDLVAKYDYINKYETFISDFKVEPALVSYWQEYWRLYEFLDLKSAILQHNDKFRIVYKENKVINIDAGLKLIDDILEDDDYTDIDEETDWEGDEDFTD